MRKQLLSLLALLLMAAGGAVAQNANSVNAREFTRTPSGTWMLNQMPGWSGQLEITLREAFRLDSIPLTWTVMVAGVDKSAQVTPYTAEEGPDTLGWLNVLEGDTVELVPPTVVKPTVKNVTLVDSDEPPAVELDASYTTWTENSTIADDLTIGSAVTVSADITLTVPAGKTLTVNGGINASDYTLTVNGAGTLTVKGTNGAGGSNSSWANAGNGGNGSAGFTGNLVVDGAIVSVTGGNGGKGGDVDGEGYPGKGGNGGNGVTGNVTVNRGSLTATGGTRGTGGYCGLSEESGSNGSAGRAVTGTVTGTITSGSATGQTVTVTQD